MEEKINVLSDIVYSNCFNINENTLGFIKEKTVYVYSINFEYITEYSLNKEYTSICYNESNDVYYAVIRGQNKLYTLNHNFVLVKEITLNIKEIYTTHINNISMIGSNILITNTNYVYEISTNGVFIKEITNKKRLLNNLCTVNINCSYFTDSIYCIDKLYICMNNYDETIIFEFIDNILTNKYSSSHTLARSMIVINKHINLFIVDECDNYIVHTNLYCKCYNDSCHKPCKCHKNCCKKCECECVEENICEIIKSVASEEEALACILEAEGKKLTKVLCVTDDVKEILAVNESINKVIKDITILENILLSKLQTAKEILCCCTNNETL